MRGVNVGKGKIIKTIVEIFFIIIAYVIMINRVKYGVEFSDESWYVAEPYVVAEKGAIPFFNNVSQSPGFTIPLAFVYKLFCLINGGTEGIVLFSRHLFLSVALIVALLTIGIVNRYTDLRIPLIITIPMFLASNPGSLFAINYHTIGLIYLPLIFALVFAEYEDDSRKSVLWGVLAGTVATRAAMGTVQIVIALGVVFVFLCNQRKTKKILGIILGCAATCLLIFGYIAVLHGFGFLGTWLKMYFNQGYFMIGNLGNLNESISALKNLFICAFVAFGFLGIAKILIKKLDSQKFSKKITFQADVCYG